MQACLGELKKEKGNESVCLFVNVDGKKLVLGTLFTEKLPQQQFDLVFDQDFELSHNWKSGSVYFFGYKAANPFEEEYPLIWLHIFKCLLEYCGLEYSRSNDSESEEDIPLSIAKNGKPESKAKQEKPVEAEKASAAKGKESDAGKKGKLVEPNKDVKSQEDDESSDEDVMSEDDDEDDSEDEDDEDESDDESDESNKKTPKKVETSKKRPVESATKTPVPTKRQKRLPKKQVISCSETILSDGKKSGGHVDTPYPAKQAAKTAANKPNQQTPKSGGSHSCKSCNRTFGSEQALESHSKAKHSGGK
ncbi:UNVERIFIED_CONTAM: Histone deacetylase HDT1 [Sesamum radiatum]|uniref:Histone deacetylase HDT1 n=1 Tax=Sesamum radiatum TaxID=300843 RepID=A0AAW2LBH2_SESRA